VPSLALIAQVVFLLQHGHTCTDRHTVVTDATDHPTDSLAITTDIVGFDPDFSHDTCYHVTVRLHVVFHNIEVHFLVRFKSFKNYIMVNRSLKI